MYSLAKQLMCCRKPSPSYPIFLYEQFYLFQLRAIKSNKPHQIVDPKSFMKAYFSFDSVDHHLPCGLYLHEYICMVDRRFNMSPYVGDIKLHAFSSFVQNQVRWELAYSAIEHNEKNVTLSVRGELKPPHDIQKQHIALLESPRVINAVKTFQDEVIIACFHTIRRNQTNVVTTCKLRWKVSSKFLNSRDPFNPSNFIQALSRVSQYVHCIKACRVHWLGLKFQNLLIQLPVDKYQISYKLSPHQEGQRCQNLVTTSVYRVRGEDATFPYNLSHLNELISLLGSDLD